MARFRGKQDYMGAWAYVLHDILYMIPVLGLIFLLVHAFGEKNENRRHYARSYFARLLLFILVCVIASGVFYLVAGSDAFSEKVNEIADQIKGVVTGSRYENESDSISQKINEISDKVKDLTGNIDDGSSRQSNAD